MEKQNIRIKLRAYDNKVLDQSTEEIVNTVKRTGANIKGPIPLPTKIEKYTVLRSMKTGDNATIKLMASVGTGSLDTMKRLILKDMIANYQQGGSYPLVNSIDMGNNTGWNFNKTPSSQQMFWRPSIANNRWDESSNWALGSSQGAPLSDRAPLPIDNVNFDSSGLTDSSGVNVILINGLSFCQDLKWSGSFPPGSSSKLHFQNGHLFINGDMDLNSHVDITQTGYLNAIFLIQKI